MPPDTNCPRCAAPVIDHAAYCSRCGIAQPVRGPAATPPAAAGGAPQPHPGPRRSRRPRWRLIAAIAVTGLVLAAAVPFVSRSIILTPAGTVAAHFAALAERDADEARSLLASNAVANAESELLTDRVLRDPGYHPPERLRIDETDSSDGRATVRGSYEIDGTQHPTELTLIRATGSRRLRPWSIESLYQLPLPTAYVATEAFVVAGTRVPAGRSSTDGVFAGGYQVGLPDNPIQEAQPISVRAGSREAGYLRPGLRHSARQSVEAQAREYVDRCAATTELAPEGCPFSAYSFTPLTDVAWKITEYPTLEITLASNGSIEVASSHGMATVTGRSQSKGGPSFSDNKSFSIHGSGQAADGRVVFLPR